MNLTNLLHVAGLLVLYWSLQLHNVFRSSARWIPEALFLTFVEVASTNVGINLMNVVSNWNHFFLYAVISSCHLIAAVILAFESSRLYVFFAVLSYVTYHVSHMDSLNSVHPIDPVVSVNNRPNWAILLSSELKAIIGIVDVMLQVRGDVTRRYTARLNHRTYRTYGSRIYGCYLSWVRVVRQLNG